MVLAVCLLLASSIVEKCELCVCMCVWVRAGACGLVMSQGMDVMGIEGHGRGHGHEHG